MTDNPRSVFPTPAQRRGATPSQRAIRPLRRGTLIGAAAFLALGAGGCASHRLPERTPAEYAADLFNTSNPDRRRDAIAYFQDHPYGNTDAYVKSYTLLATDPDPLVRAQAMRALGVTGRYQVADTLIAGMKDPNVMVRHDATVAAENVNNPALIDPLIDRLANDPDYEVRTAATVALKKYDVPRVLLAYAAALNDTAASVAYNAYQNLKQATGQTTIAMDQHAWVNYLNHK